MGEDIKNLSQDYQIKISECSDIVEQMIKLSKSNEDDQQLAALTMLRICIDNIKIHGTDLFHNFKTIRIQ
jgi:hypothetical protein